MQPVVCSRKLLRGESVNVRVRKDLNDMAVSPMVHEEPQFMEVFLEDNTETKDGDGRWRAAPRECVCFS